MASITVIKSITLAYSILVPHVIWLAGWFKNRRAAAWSASAA